jgi:riboflavin synthase
MFTGIIETVGTVNKMSSRGNYRLLTVRPGKPFRNIIRGESIAVDGCCLTVTDFGKDDFKVEASPETVKRTIIDSYRAGARINLERALIATGRLGGHFVTGHIDTVGYAENVVRIGESIELTALFPEEFADLLVAKGSVAVNGISLTVNEISGGRFKVNVIPHTHRATTIENMKAGDRVNLEFDLIGKYVVRLLGEKNKGSLTIDKLIESGW